MNKYWARIVMNFLLLIFIVVAASFMAGCSVPKTKAQRAVMEHQTEGRLVYREVDGVQYYVECEYGFKYLSSTASNERIGPVDVCEGEEEE